MQQSKRTAVARVILGTPKSLYFWPSIGVRWPKWKGAAEHCAYVPIAARPQPTVSDGVVGFRRSVIHVGAPHAPSPLCPRSIPRETDCIQTRGANCSRGARVQEPNYGHGALLPRTATGHAVTAPPSRLMNSRRFTLRRGFL